MCIEKLLEEDTKMLVTAEKWVIHDMVTNQPLKGFKHKKEHDIASLTKVLTFYTAFKIISEFYLTLDKLEMFVDAQDEQISGTRLNIEKESIVTLEDLLYGMMLSSANNAASTIATNLGSLVRKKKANKYFSCFDIPLESKEENLSVFLDLMNSHAKELGMASSSFVNVHGLSRNKSTARDIAVLMTACF